MSDHLFYESKIRIDVRERHFKLHKGLVFIYPFHGNDVSMVTNILAFQSFFAMCSESEFF